VEGGDVETQACRAREKRGRQAKESNAEIKAEKNGVARAVTASGAEGVDFKIGLPKVTCWAGFPKSSREPELSGCPCRYWAIGVSSRLCETSLAPCRHAL